MLCLIAILVVLLMFNTFAARQPGTARKSQGQPGTARDNQAQPGTARNEQGQPGTTKNSTGAARNGEQKPPLKGCWGVENPKP